MQYLRLSGTPDLDVAPPAFRLIAASPHVEEARLQAWNLSDSRGMTGLFAVDGDRDALETALAETPETVSVETVPAGPTRFFLLVTLSSSVEPLISAVFETLTSDGLVVLLPVIYRDGEVRARMLGSPEAVQAALSHMPSAVDVDVTAVGSGNAASLAPGDAGAVLSDRQREAVRVALDLGYYDQPRRATHADIADRLGCAPSTASEHLLKAEAKLVRAGLS